MKTQKIVLIFLIVLLCNSHCNLFAQSYSIGHTTVNFIDASRNNRSIPTEIYYPSNTAGNDVSVVSNNFLKFPALVFGHGFLMTWDAYQNIWESIVPNGYVMAFPKTEGGFSPSHLEYAKDLSFVINQMNELGANSTSIFFDRISNMNAVMGHSMGGGAAFLATQLNANIKTIVTFSAAETSPSAIAASSSIVIPSLVFAGSNDCVTPPISNQLSMYNVISSSCKTYISISGGSHCQMANSNLYCTLGESSCTPIPTISRDFQHLVLNDYIVKWLEYQLKNDCVLGSQFDTLIISDSRITFQKNCSQCDTMSNNIVYLKNQFKIYPNEFTDVLYFSIDSNETFRFSIFDSSLKEIRRQNFVNFGSIDTSSLPSGWYFYEITSGENSIKSGKVLKK